MIFTRHLVILAGLFSAALTIILVFVYVVRQQAYEPEYAGVQFVPSGELYTVSVSSDNSNTRQPFIDKVRNALTQSPPEEPTADEVVISAPAGTDGQYSTYTRPFVSVFPQAGALFACTLNSIDTASPSETPWIINETQWDPTQKPTVGGNVLEYGSVSIDTVEDNRVITFQGVPNHAIGTFPVTADDPTYIYGVNTYAVGVFNSTLTLPSTPELALAPSCIGSDVVGVLNSGALLFRGVLSSGSDAQLGALTDSCDGHADRLGRYHYHEESSCIQPNSDGAIGYALDGFGIFPSIEEGRKISNADLDACHGHSHSVVWNEKVTNIYHYHMTDEYPYSVGCFMGTAKSIEVQ